MSEMEEGGPVCRDGCCVVVIDPEHRPLWDGASMAGPMFHETDSAVEYGGPCYRWRPGELYIERWRSWTP